MLNRKIHNPISIFFIFIYIILLSPINLFAYQDGDTCYVPMWYQVSPANWGTSNGNAAVSGSVDNEGNFTFAWEEKYDSTWGYIKYKTRQYIYDGVAQAWTSGSSTSEYQQISHYELLSQLAGVACQVDSDAKFSTAEIERCFSEYCEADPCEDQIAEKIIECGGEQYIDYTNYNPELCTGLQCTCNQERLDAETYCADGYNFNPGTCAWECYDCDDYLLQKEVECGLQGQVVWWVTCNINDSYDPSEKYAIKDGECKDPDTDEPTPALTPPDNDDPANPPQTTPDPTPTPDPADTPDQQNLEVLQTINNNQNNIVNQNNQSNVYLSNVAQNIQNINNNQTVLNNSINELGKQLAAQSKAEVAAAQGASKGELKIAGEIEEVQGILNSMKYTGEVPSADDYDFDGTIEGYGYNYSEYGEAGPLAETKATTDSTGIYNSYKDDPLPFNTSLTASADACLNGSIHNTTVNICFDKPWMLTGFGLMKIILIGVGYLQTAMLLNRAILS